MKIEKVFPRLLRANSSGYLNVEVTEMLADTNVRKAHEYVANYDVKARDPDTYRALISCAKQVYREDYQPFSIR